MSKQQCKTCKESVKGCERLAGQSDKRICLNYDPVIDCTTCKYDGLQIVERRCLKCGAVNNFINWSLKI